MSARPSTRHLSRVASCVVRLAFLVLLLLPLWLFPYVPMTDAPNHLLAAFIAVHYNDPRFSFPTYFTVDLTPRSNILGHYIMIVLLELGLSPEDTLRVLASLIVLLTVGGLYVLLRVARGREHARAWFLLGVPLAYSWFFHQGFLNFTLGVGLGLFTLAAAIYFGVWGTPSPSPLPPRGQARDAGRAFAVLPPARMRGGKRAHWWGVLLVALLAYLAYLAHALGLALALVGGAALTVGELARGLRVGARRASPTATPVGARHAAPLQRPTWMTRASPLPRAIAPLILLAAIVWATGRLSPNARGEAAAFLTPPFIVWVPLSKKIAELRYGLFSFSPQREQFILLPATLLYLFAWLASLRRPSRWHLPALLALGLYFLLPMGFWVPFIIYERFWLFALLLGTLALGGKGNSWTMDDGRWTMKYGLTIVHRLVPIVLLLTTVAFLANLTNDYRIANRDLAAYDRVLADLPRGAWAFPFTYHHQGRISPARHFWAYAMMRQDVFIPMVFAETYHPVQYRPDVPRPYPLEYEKGFFAEHAHNRATLWVKASDPLMQEKVLPFLERYGYRRAGRIGPYLVYRLTTWPPPIPPEARPHITPDVARAYDYIFVYGYPPNTLVSEIERYYRLEVESGLARRYKKGR